MNTPISDYILAKLGREGVYADLVFRYADPTDRTVTLLAAVRDGEHICVAADSLQIWQVAGYGSECDKLEQYGERVVWGFYGPGPIEACFKLHLNTIKYPLTWDDLSYKVQWAAILTNRQSWDTGGFSALFAGRLGNVWGIRAYGGRALVSDPRGEWCLVGVNRLAGKVAWEITLAAASIEDRLGGVMNTVVKASPAVLGLPVKRWAITPNACTLIS